MALTDNEICKGCGNDGYDEVACVKLVNREKAECPCSICLIKGMCEIACEDFQNYLFKYTGKYYE